MINQKGFASIIIVIIAGVIALGAGIGLRYYQESRISSRVSDISNEPLKTANNDNKSGDKAVAVSEQANCDNYPCLISVVSECQPAIGVISYSGVPNPLLPDILMAGQNKYEIKKSPDVNKCVFIFSNLATTLSVSETGHKTALAQGVTEKELNDQLQAMNDSFKGTFGIPTTCVSSVSAISAYLTDLKNGAGGESEVSYNLMSGVSTTSIITSSGQELVCTTQQPPSTFVPAQ